MAALRKIKILKANKTKLITTVRLMLYARSLLSKNLFMYSFKKQVRQNKVIFLFSDGPLFCYDLAINAVIPSFNISRKPLMVS
jgi:hypothetical protein